jgi:hypothetical protein
MTAPKSPKPYVSPMRWAREVLSPEATQIFPGKVRAIAQHIIQLSVMVVADLEAEEAPIHVFRWVAWASGATAQRRRTDLVLHLRRALERSRNGWLEERHLTAALAVWESAIQSTRLRGLIAPRPEGVPIERYRDAVDAARKRSRLAREEPLDAAPGLPKAAAPPLLDTADAPADAKRAAVLQHLTAGLVEAVGAGDFEAARAANDAITKLLASG